jgi:hypothetical protein
MENKEHIQADPNEPVKPPNSANGKQKPVVPSVLPETAYSDQIETYSEERIAEFLLTNAVDAEEYERAKEEVRSMGLDPETIVHRRPTGV